MGIVVKQRVCILIIISCVVVSCASWLSFSSPITSVEFINVGQADCALVTSAGGRRVLIDSGRYSKDGDSDIYSFLVKRGIRKLDVAVISHYHDDHYGGLLDLIDKRSISLILLPLPQIKEEEIIVSYISSNIKDDTAKIAFFKTGERINIGENIVLTPLLSNDQVADANDRGIVMMLQCFDKRFLFTGDITSEAEEKLLSIYPSEDLDADVLKIAHHGSKYSSSQEFCDAVSPEYSVISVGKNSYGHPSKDVIDRLSAYSKILRTDSNGNITFYIDEESFRVSTVR